MSLADWFQIAFEKDLEGGLNLASVGKHRLAVARSADKIRVFDAVCPHRGANLARGGKLVGDRIICPFHGYEIHCGVPAEDKLYVTEHHTIVAGGLIFVHCGSGSDGGFSSFIQDIERQHIIVPGFAMPVNAPARLVTENAFDAAHFPIVHGTKNKPRFRNIAAPDGQFAAEGTLDIPASLWQQTKGSKHSASVPFVVRAFGPGLVVSFLGGERSYWTITAATPEPDGSSIVRFSLAFPMTAEQTVPSERVQYLVRQSRAGIKMDQDIWEHLKIDAQEQLTEDDALLEQFRSFCDRLA